MRFLSHVPGMPLRQFVENFWWCSDAPGHAMERIVPSGTVELVFNLREDEVRIYDRPCAQEMRQYHGAVISGTYGRPFLIDSAQHGSMLGVHFRPGGAGALLRSSMRWFADTHVDLQAVWGREAVDLRARLCDAQCPRECFTILEAALTQRIHAAPATHGAVTAALTTFQRTSGQTPVRDVAKHVGLSQRRFIHVFTEQVGLTPKLFSRIQRFQRARSLAIGTGGDWARRAAACGYFDQSHLIRDFQEFAGLNPGEYLRRRSSDVMSNHVPAD